MLQEIEDQAPLMAPMLDYLTYFRQQWLHSIPPTIWNVQNEVCCVCMRMYAISV